MRSINQIAADTANIYWKLSQKCKYPRIPCLIYFRYSFRDSFFYAMCMCHIDSFIVGNSGLFDCVVGSYDKLPFMCMRALYLSSPAVLTISTPWYGFNSLMFS